MQHTHQRPSAGQSARTAFWSAGRARSQRPELAVGRTDDPLERAADSVADQVMREPGADSARGRAPAGRGSSAPAAVAGAALALIEDVLRAPGQALDAVTRGFMEARFGYDFSRIRVHADPPAAESAQSVRAAAYTVGQDVVFGAGQYAPGREGGRRLLAHELAHTIQQRAPGPPLIRRQPADEGPTLTGDHDQPILIQHGLPAETPDASVQRKLDEFRDRMKATYHVGPDTASVAPPFGMGEGYPSQKAMAKDPDNIRHLRNIKKKPGGRGLGPLRESMESAFGETFSAVRLRHDGVADAHDAHAVTIGEDVHLSGAAPDVSSTNGRQLVAHELAHVIQQRGDRASATAAPLLEAEADRAATAAAAGCHVHISSGTGSSAPLPQRKPKIAPPKPVGNILYVGMNNADPEIAALSKRYQPGGPISVATIKGTSEEQATSIGSGSTFDLTTSAGCEALAKALTADATKQTQLAALICGQSRADRDDLAHVAKVYADTEADGKDRMTRVVLSGHSGGMGVFGSSGELYFKALVDLANIFPTAASQTKHLIVAGCHTGDEGTILDYYVKAFPNVQTVWAWWDVCPTGAGAAAAIVQWAGMTEHGEKKLPKEGGGIATWSGGVYEGSPSGKAQPSEVLSSIRADATRFGEYFNGTRADAGPHGGWLETFYGRVFAAARRPDIAGADHDEMEKTRHQALMLRFWKNVAKNYWTSKGAVISRGYGSATVPDYPHLSRADALKAIADFPATAGGAPADKTAAQQALDKLRSLDDSNALPETMVND
jgi:hypothetical protein